MDRMNMDEDEVIQHSMITKSIERAQKKVEENNFAIRKRLLEYDNVMNSQREVIYKKRRNAIIGERLEVDILNTIYDTCDDIVLTSKQNDNYKDFRLNVLTILGLDYSKLSEDDFRQKQPEEITKSLFEAVNDNYNRKNNSISEAAYPILKKIKKERGGVVKDILIPFTDGNRQIGVSVNLEDSLESKGKNIIKEMQKTVCLGMIDLNWKEHLREMDDLKQSVQSAVYEQKDPLVIYKFEGFELFKKFIAKVNQDTVSFLTKCLIPIQSSSQVEESKQTKDRNRYDTNKEESRSLLTGNKTQQIEKTKPIKSEKVFGRNTKVSVRYEDGTVKKDIKFKKVENDINSEKCVVIED
tara:strand:- start:20 stop:1081 length:1062 start_codon:yes stop_codon:yes gene_type:complete